MTKNKIFKISKNFFFCSLLILLGTPLLAQELKPLDIEKPATLSVAKIQGLNKITAKSSIIKAKIGEEIDFGQISIITHKCWRASLEEKPEAKLLIEVFENKDNKKERIFFGWIFSSTPSISGLEHPIYDLTALDCN